MKLQLNTIQKTIQIEEVVTIGDLIDVLEELLPNGKWAEYTLIPDTKVEWTRGYPMYPLAPQPSTTPVPDYPWIVLSEVRDYNVKYGVYNISTSE